MQTLKFLFIAAFSFFCLANFFHSSNGQEVAKTSQRWSAGLYSMRDQVERGGSHLLLDAPSVRKELKLNSSDETRLKTLKNEVQKLGLSQPMEKNDINNHDAMLKIFVERYEKQQRLAEFGTKQILSRSQARRLEEISLQLVGILAVARPDMQDRLNMNPSQSLNTTEIFNEYNARKIEIFKKRREDVNSVTKNLRKSNSNLRKSTIVPETTSRIESGLDKSLIEFEAMRQKAEREIARHLTRNQKSKFEKMCGIPFKEIDKLLVPGYDFSTKPLSIPAQND